MNEHHERLMLVVGMYTNQARAQQLVEKLIQEDFPMDRISLLSRVGGAGDDMLGVTYHDTGERVKAWGKHGAFWGAVWGLLASASGMFVLPGLGPLLGGGADCRGFGRWQGEPWQARQLSRISLLPCIALAFLKLICSRLKMPLKPVSTW